MTVRKIIDNLCLKTILFVVLFPVHCYLLHILFIIFSISIISKLCVLKEKNVKWFYTTFSS